MSSTPSAALELATAASLPEAEPVQSTELVTAAAPVTGEIMAARAPIGMAALATAGTGVVVALGGAVWAVQADVAYPIAIMAGYCTLAATLCATVALRQTPEQPVTASVVLPTEPTVTRGPTTHFEAWRLVNKFSVSDAARLWCDLEPGSNVTQETIAWARVLLDAISRGELPMVEKPGARKEAIEQERNNPTWHTEMTREALTAWAKSHDFNPRFLQS
ncbi:MAG: hypothetical protein GC182_04810 [Rhodopseudomonas sp.]|nr:hypothetical protein [Rhodopseudomonas sp.]